VLNKVLKKQGLNRMFLHAAQLEFDHPATGERLELTAELPADLQNFLGQLEAHEERDYGAELPIGSV